MLFYYKREVKETVPVENPAEGEPKYTVVTNYVEDCFNVNKVIRGHWVSKDTFTVMLDDGHEQADEVEKPKLNAKRQVVGVEVKRERGWYMSQINLDKEDAERLRVFNEGIAKMYQ
jgi:hypothetical protein